MYVASETSFPKVLPLFEHSFIHNKPQLLDSSMLHQNGFSKDLGNGGFDPLKIWGDLVIVHIDANYGLFQNPVSTIIPRFTVPCSASDNGADINGVLNRVSRNPNLGQQQAFPNLVELVSSARNGLAAFNISSFGVWILNAVSSINHNISTGVCEMFVVIKRGSVTGVITPICSFGGGVDAPSLLVCDATSDVFNLRSQSGPVDRRFDTTLTGGTDYILNISQSGLTGGTSLYINNTKEATTHNAVNFGTTTPFRLGNCLEGANNYDSYIYEFILIKKFFTDLERESMYKYLSSKYAI